MSTLFNDVPLIWNEHITLRRLMDTDAAALHNLAENERVYTYLPTFLFEQQVADSREAIRLMYESLFRNKEAVFLAVDVRDESNFCGLAELYGFNVALHKISMGYRLLPAHWGKGIATSVVGLLVDYLYTQTEIKIITASTMIENLASERVLLKNGFIQTAQAIEEDWGYDQPTMVNKWLR